MAPMISNMNAENVNKMVKTKKYNVLLALRLLLFVLPKLIQNNRSSLLKPVDNCKSNEESYIWADGESFINESVSFCFNLFCAD